MYMDLQKLDGEWSVCQLRSAVGLDKEKPFLFLGKTDRELSAVCPTEYCKSLDCVKQEDGWCGFRVEGTLDFSLIGILAEISAILAGADIGIFVISTFDTDYVWVKKERWEDTKAILEENGYQFR